MNSFRALYNRLKTLFLLFFFSINSEKKICFFLNLRHFVVYQQILIATECTRGTVILNLNPFDFFVPDEPPATYLLFEELRLPVIFAYKVFEMNKNYFNVFRQCIY